MKKLTDAESQRLYDQTFANKAIDDKCDVELSRRVAEQFCHEFRIPEMMHVVLMDRPECFVDVGGDRFRIVVSSRRFYAREDSIVLDICDSVEDEMFRFYAERGEMCFLGLYWLPWKYHGDRLWWFRYALTHVDWKNNDTTIPYVR